MLRSATLRNLTVCLAPIFACGGTSDDAATEPRPEARVIGTLRLREGDCMPVTTPERCRVRGISSRVEAYPRIHLEKNKSGSYDYRLPPAATPVGSTLSDAEGRFSFVLPEGRYSILTFYEDRWYPTSSASGEWAAVEVNTAWLEDVEIEINRATD